MHSEHTVLTGELKWLLAFVRRVRAGRNRLARATTSTPRWDDLQKHMQLNQLTERRRQTHR